MSFQTIDNFIIDIFECAFLKNTLDAKLCQIQEIVLAHQTVKKISEERRFPFSEEFLKNVFPILEVALQ